MTNIYWPVYKSLESEVEALTFSIHIDDAQLGVYSSKITDLILRAAVEIESISKELYAENGGTKTGKDVKYDDDCIKLLRQLWLLDEKIVVISSANCFQSVRELTPFVKNETRTYSAKQTYSWNNAYQNLKHDRSNSLEFGNIRHLFDIMAALYVLNIYYKDDETFELGSDHQGTSFPAHQGSSLFSVRLENRVTHDGKHVYMKSETFDQSVHFVDWTDESGARFVEAQDKVNAEIARRTAQHPKILAYLEQVAKSEEPPPTELGWGTKLIGTDEYIKIMQQSHTREAGIAMSGLEYCAKLNKNQM